MNIIVRRRLFTITAFFIAVIFWLLEASIHYFVFNEPRFEFFPSEVNELWMRIVIFLLIILFGVFADSVTDRIVFKQLEVAHTYTSMIHVSHHVLNNVINQMQLFKIEALRNESFDRDVINLYDNAIKEASDLGNTLSKVKDITELDIWNSSNEQEQ